MGSLDFSCLDFPKEKDQRAHQAGDLRSTAPVSGPTFHLLEDTAFSPGVSFIPSEPLKKSDFLSFV